MPAAETPSSASERDILRQREIETQRNALQSPVSSSRAAAARRLGDLQAGAEALLDALKDPSESVRSAAAMALGSFQHNERLPEIIDYLLSAIDDISAKVCQSAIRSLGMLRAEEARADIETFLSDQNPFILGAAILALARLGADDLAVRLTGFLNHESAYVKMQAARAAAVLNYTPAGPQIVRLLENTRALRLADGFSDPVARRNRNQDDLYNLQNQLIRAAGELKQQEAVPILLEIAQKDIGFRGLAVEALIAIGAEIDLPILAGLLTDPSVYLRKRLILLIAQYHYQPALPLLRHMLDEENVTVRVAALQALTSFQDTLSLPHIAWMCYHDSNPFIRVQAVQALSALHNQPVSQRAQALSHLMALAVDANYQVRYTAVCQLIEWDLKDNRVLPVLARFALDFPADPISPQILSLLDESGYDSSQVGDLVPAETPGPADFAPNAGALLVQLETWQGALEQQLSPTHQEVSAALAFLIDTLRSR